MRMLPQLAADTRRWITPEPLNLAPQLIGLPLAPPSRRALAMGLDLLVVALLTGVSGLWLLGGLALVLLQLRSRGGSPARFRKRALVGWTGAALIVLLALQEAGSQWQDWRQPAGRAAHGKRAAAQALTVAADAIEQAADEADADDEKDARQALRAAAAALGGASAPPAAASAASASSAALSDRARIALLERELAEARKPRRWRDQLSKFVSDTGAGLGWGIVYFSLLPAWWGGQTVGKKVFGLQVVELTGKPMTVMRSLKRYGGYAAGLATGGLGFMQVLWDPNRQGLHDKAAHTAVIDLRAPPRLPHLDGAPGAP
jgi:uncharacterized RDD family membrane protein YckC